MPSLQTRLLQATTNRLHLSVLLCTGPHCRRFSLAHRFLRKDGIFLGEQWLCSPHCFEAALHQGLSQAQRPTGLAKPRLPRMPFRLLLLGSGTLSEAQLQAAQTHAEQHQRSLADTLLELDMLSEEQLSAALAREAGCAFYTLPPASLPCGFQLPRALATQAAIVDVSPTRLLVGFTRRIDRSLLALAEQLTGRRAEACFLTETRLAAQLALVPQTKTASDERLPLASAVRAILERALQSAAEQVLLGRSGDLAWVRYHCRGSAWQDSLLHLQEETLAENRIAVPHGIEVHAGASRKHVLAKK